MSHWLTKLHMYMDHATQKVYAKRKRKERRKWKSQVISRFEFVQWEVGCLHLFKSRNLYVALFSLQNVYVQLNNLIVFKILTT